MGDEASKYRTKKGENLDGDETRESRSRYYTKEITPEIAFYLPEYAKNTKVIKCAIVGGGIRGQCYAQYSKDFPHLVKIVAIADPRLSVRKLFATKYDIPENMQFCDWSDLAHISKVADFVCICTPDKLHKDPAVAFARKGYHILLEKPMATTKEDCIAIADECKKHNVMFAVCHVLRYYPPNKKIKELIDSGIIGDVVNIQHLEPVGNWHFAHSYVRGNWRNTKESSFSLLAKCCHDVDLITYWMKSQKGKRSGKQCTCVMISSFGSLNHFKKENMPAGAGETCLDCSVEDTCPYSAVKIYINRAKSEHWGWPVSVVTDVEDMAVLTDRLRNGPYGRCVYNCDNDVCDNQVVNFQFSGGQTATLTMIAFTESICARKTRIFGTKGELTYNGGTHVKHYDFLSKSSRDYHCAAGLADLTRMRGHGGADFHLIDSFVKALLYNDSSYIQSGPEETLQSHLLVFAAEESRVCGKTLYLKEDGSWH